MLRLLGWLFGFGVFCALGAVAIGAVYLNDLTAKLPDYTVLKDYQPPVTTRVHAADGTLLAEYARERRLFQPIETIPPILVEAFLSAEDKDFYKHGGLSVDGIARALRDNVMARIDGNASIQGGGSTITQQVAKNFLLSSEQTWDRKIQEAILALQDRVDLLEEQDPRALRERDLPRFGWQIPMAWRRRR
jgi:penicillin-binding protein 1A